MKYAYGTMLICALAACGDDAAAPAGPSPAAPLDAGSNDASSNGGPSDATPPPDVQQSTTVRLGGVTRTFDPTKDLSMQALLAGVEVCVVAGAAPSCQTTDATGKWHYDLPRNDKNIRLTFSAPGHLALYVITFTQAVDRDDFDWILVPDAVIQSFYGDCGATYPETQAGVLLHGIRYQPPNIFKPLDGATVAGSVGVGACYFAKPYEYDAQVTTTKTEGLGYALFANVPVANGEMDATITVPGATCRSNANIANAPAPNTVRVPLKAGFQTVLDVLCE